MTTETISANGIKADYTVTPSRLGQLLDALTERNRPVFVWGPPGIGKTESGEQSATRTNRHYVDIRALEYDPVDFSGLPYVKDDETHWATPGFLPPADSKEKFLINLDELSSAPLSVQTALYKLVLNRRAGDHYKLPDGAAIIACGNRIKDGGQVYRMPKALANRFRHIDLVPDAEEWDKWAVQAGVAVEVILFLRFRPDLLFQFNPRSEENAFPTPRSWRFVGEDVELLDQGLIDSDLARSLFRGTVGEGAAVEFSAFLKVYRELDDPRTILDNPASARIPEDKSALIAVCAAISRVVKSDVDMENVVAYASRIPREIGEHLISATVKETPDTQYTRAYIAWCQATA